MNKVGWFSRLFNQQTSTARMQCIAGGFGIAILLLMTGIAAAQSPAPSAPMAIPGGYSSHETVDFGGRVANIKGSGAMYDSLVNQQSGPRLLGATFELRALPTNKHTQVDSLHAIVSGLGGDPNNFAKLDFSKGKLYEFSGMFRRDRQYADYDLLGNPNITTGQSIPIGPSNAPTGSLAWPQVKDSSVMFNTVRRMTDTNITFLPLSKVTFRVGYSQNIMQGNTLTPSYTIAKYNALLQEYQRNSTDEYMGAVDWKPMQGTKLTFEEVITHFKTGSFFTLNPNGFLVQEASGTPVYLGNWDSQTAYGIAACNTGSMGTAYTSSSVYTILSTAPAGGLPVINAACDAVISYTRTQPTRILTPTEIFRFQSFSLKNLSMNGDIRYTNGNMNMPSYNESYQGLNGQTTSVTYTALGSANRAVVSGDYGFTWQALKKFAITYQVDYNNVHQPGTTTFTSKTTLATPTNPSEVINYAGTLTTTVATTGTSTITGASAVNTPEPAFFGQKFLTSNLTGTWDASSRATLAVTYRYRHHVIGEALNGIANAPLAQGAVYNNGTVTINEDGGIFNVALRPAKNWDVNSSFEMIYDDNAFTPVGPRQTKHYRVHSIYKPKPWATFSGAYNDVEKHNNTNNNQYAVTVQSGSTTAALPNLGPLNHVDRSRVASFGAVLAPNTHYGFDLNYAYSDVYASTNICYLNGATTTLPGAATAPGTTLPNTPYIASNGACATKAVASGTTPSYTDWYGVDFMDAPTQYVSTALRVSPVEEIHANIGYRISDVNGTRFFNDARDVSGSLVSKYQTPFVNLAWTLRPGLVWKVDYNYFGYGEGGPSGSPYCSTSTSGTATVVPCNSSTIAAYPTGLTEPTSGLTAPRTFHANNVTLSLHYEF